MKQSRVKRLRAEAWKKTLESLKGNHTELAEAIKGMLKAD